MQPIGLSRTRAAPVDRSADRRVALAGITLAACFLAAALLTIALPPGTRHGWWLPLHLALAGGASTAIAGVMPFFVAAFAAAQPGAPWLRGAAVGAIALGAAGVALGVTIVAGGWLAPVSGLVFIGGIVLTAAATVQPVAGSLGPSRGVVTRAYLAALVAVIIGASFATLQLAGWEPVVGAWARLRPVHAWLNLIGFVSLVIATTLLHFFPTVVGARIAQHPSARLTITGIGGGAAVVAAGYLIESGLLVRLGATVCLVGAAALMVYAERIWRTRARWTTDLEWHRVAIFGLVSAIGWFGVGILILAGRAWAFGAAPGGWSIEVVFSPLVAGWIGLGILASATHLVPAVGPGDHAAHARQRAILGRGSSARLAAADCGIAALAIGIPLGLGLVTTVGAVLLALAFAATAMLLGLAIRIGVRPTPRPASVLREVDADR